MTTRPIILCINSVLLTLTITFSVSAQPSEEERLQWFRQMSANAEQNGLAEPFKGVTAAGLVEEGLFEISSSGVSTAPVVEAARQFLAALSPEQRARTVFAVDDPEWRKWMNQHFYIRQGVGFDRMDQKQRDAAFHLLRQSLSAKGLKLSRDIMNLNYTLGEMNRNNLSEYNERLYWVTVMGEPSSTEPWGWQLDGHHLNINYFVLGDQVVMTPLFVGSEPVRADSGRFAGTVILQEEQSAGLEMLRALSEKQRSQAVLATRKTGNNNLGEAFSDNIVLDYAGVPANSFNEKQKDRLLQLIKLYVDNMDDGHARVRMAEVRKYIDRTWFAWIGGDTDADVYYYRIHSPVILIEFDHQKPAGLRNRLPRSEPNRQHIHVVVRTPNGNDYGKDLLRQHYENHAH